METTIGKPNILGNELEKGEKGEENGKRTIWKKGKKGTKLTKGRERETNLESAEWSFGNAKGQRHKKGGGKGVELSNNNLQFLKPNNPPSICF